VRAGCAAGKRAVNTGSSKNTVPVPTTIASADRALASTSARAARCVIPWMLPSAAAFGRQRWCEISMRTCGKPGALLCSTPVERTAPRQRGRHPASTDDGSRPSRDARQRLAGWGRQPSHSRKPDCDKGVLRTAAVCRKVAGYSVRTRCHRPARSPALRNATLGVGPPGRVVAPRRRFSPSLSKIDRTHRRIGIRACPGPIGLLDGNRIAASRFIDRGAWTTRRPCRRSASPADADPRDVHGPKPRTEAVKPRLGRKPRSALR